MKNKLLKTQVIIIILIITGKLIAFLRESVLAAKFGTSFEMDIYSFSMTCVLFLATIGYAITTTIIPIFSELKEKATLKEQEKVANNLIWTMAMLGVIITIISIFLSKFIVHIFAPGFTGENLILANKLLIIMNFSLISIFIQSVISGVLQAHGRFYTSSAMALVGNIVMILYLFMFIDKFGMIGFGVSTVIAYLMQLLINIPSYRKIGLKFYFYINLKDEKLKEIIKLCIPILISTCIMQMVTFVNNFFGSIIGEGAIAVYNYSNRLISIGVEVFAIGISMVIYPQLSKVGANKNKELFSKYLSNGIIMMALIILPISVLLLTLRVDIIRFLFERNSFTATATALTASTLLLLIPTMVSLGLRDLLNKGYYALKDTKTPMIISVLTIVINVIANFLLYKKYGILTLGIGTSIASVFGVVLTLILLIKKHRFTISDVIGSLIKITLASIVMMISVLIIKNYWAISFANSLMDSFITIVVCSLLSICIYIVLIFVFKVKEVKGIFKK